MSRKLKVIRNQIPSKKPSLSERYLLGKKKMPLDDSQLVKLNWKERLKVRVENVIEDFVMTFPDSWISYIFKIVLFAALFTSCYVFFLVRTNERVEAMVERSVERLIDFAEGNNR